ncbi:hypothetical protein DX903_06105 [Adlercreutzia equolifaciens]|nr:hypothetical protein DX903_06105 [Adlercreutzia equolifaciens]
MEIANEILGLLTSVVVLATAVVKLYIQSAEQKRLSEKKRGRLRKQPTLPLTTALPVKQARAFRWRHHSMAKRRFQPTS